jgi:hypothetical protein
VIFSFSSETGFKTCNLLLGTHTSAAHNNNNKDNKDMEQNYLMTANVKLPNDNTSLLGMETLGLFISSVI